MPQGEKPQLVSWIYRTDLDSAIQLESLIVRGARVILNKNQIDAEAYAHANLNAIWNLLLRSEADYESRGVSRVFKPVDPVAHTLSWCSADQGLSSGARRRLLKLRHRPAILRTIDALRPRDYEALACQVSKALGASKIVLTPPGNEGGVDFFALLTAVGRGHLFAGGTHPLRIVGQCKKYTSPVQSNGVKEFITTLTEVKHGGEPKTERIIPSWFRESAGPIVGLMISHSGFQSGAKSRAKKHGIVLADSLDVAEILTLCRSYPEHLSGDERAALCKSEIAQWLVP